MAGQNSSFSADFPNISKGIPAYSTGVAKADATHPMLRNYASGNTTWNGPDWTGKSDIKTPNSQRLRWKYGGIAWTGKSAEHIDAPFAPTNRIFEIADSTWDAVNSATMFDRGAKRPKGDIPMNTYSKNRSSSSRINGIAISYKKEAAIQRNTGKATPGLAQQSTSGMFDNSGAATPDASDFYSGHIIEHHFYIFDGGIRVSSLYLDASKTDVHILGSVNYMSPGGTPLTKEEFYSLYPNAKFNVNDETYKLYQSLIKR